MLGIDIGKERFVGYIRSDPFGGNNDRMLPEYAKVILAGPKIDGKGGLSLAFDHASEWERIQIKKAMGELCDFAQEDCEFTHAYLINDPNSMTLGVKHGHNAVMLANNCETGLFFSFWPSPEGQHAGAFVSVDGILHFAVLNKNNTTRIKERDTYYSPDCVGLYWDWGKPKGWAGNDLNHYMNNLEIHITHQEGTAIAEKAAKIFAAPGRYSAASRQCADVANDILAAGVKVTGHGWPNDVYNKMVRKYEK